MFVRPIIAIIPQALANHPALAGVRSPVTVEHSPYNCPRCGQTCWIGPKQKIAATSGGGETLCYTCIFADPTLAEAVRGGSMISLNPDIENAPRRNGQA